MGLSGRKVKQRIPADPRNLAWADDAAKFGTNYLSKFGWDASKGLGVEGDGRTSHIKVSHKLDMLGIGAAHQMDPNGIAWKQNKDFENLLKRLNDAAVVEDTLGADKGTDVKEEARDEVDEEEGDSETKDKKRKRKKDREGASEEKAKKKRKKSKEDEALEEEGRDAAKSVKEVAKVEDAPAQPPKPFVPRNRAHRARAIASKSIASKSQASIAEILGIAPTPSMSATASGLGTPLGKLTPLDDGSATLEKLTTSTKSVADYFKEKLLAKSSKSGVAASFSEDKREDAFDAPRGGLGSSRLRPDTNQESLDSESQRIGLSKFSSLMSSTFLSATTSLDDGSRIDDLDRERKKAKKEKKERKEKAKERRHEGAEDAPMDVEERVEEALSKEERRRLRKEKKSRKDGSS